MADVIILHKDVIDAEFETVVGGNTSSFAPSIKVAPRGESHISPDQLSLLRDQFADCHPTSQPDSLSPLFICVTVVCGFVVFWVCGGHVLLY